MRRQLVNFMPLCLLGFMAHSGLTHNRSVGTANLLSAR